MAWPLPVCHHVLGITAPLIPPMSPRCPFYTQILEANNILTTDINITLNQNHYMTWFLSNILVSPNEESEVYFQEDAGIHVMNMYMGVPQQLLYGIFDTGSAVTWFQCEKCASEVKYPCFNKTNSFSYSTIRCDDKQKCNTKYGYIKGCDELQSSCEFNLTYGDGSNAYGEMATEYTTFDWSRRHLVLLCRFGCSWDNNAKLMGVIGASNNEYAITKQLYPNDPKFSYCISSDYDTINLLMFGPKANLKGQAIKMLKNAYYDFYYIDVLGIKVNGEHLAVAPSVFQMSDSGTRGFIIDSGTTLTYLASDAFEALKKRVEELLGPLPST